jgi:hypothetical protein
MPTGSLVREAKQTVYSPVSVFEDLYGNRWDLAELTSGYLPSRSGRVGWWDYVKPIP